VYLAHKFLEVTPTKIDYFIIINKMQVLQRLFEMEMFCMTSNDSEITSRHG
jgi:hypothetical protein